MIRKMLSSVPPLSRRRPHLPALALLLVVAACHSSGDAANAASAATSSAESGAASAAPSSGPSSTPLTPAPGRHVINVTVTTEASGSYFKPAEIEAKRGDVLRFTLGTGVHNIHFLPDSNPGKSGLPPASDFLQLPGQSVDFLVTFAPGKYYFQCDPHAALGMKGRLEVED